MSQIDCLPKLYREKCHLKLGIKESLTSPTCGYMAVMLILLTIKPRLKEKWHLAHEPVLLSATKQRINEEFGMVSGFLSKEISSLMSQNFDTRTRQALNQ